MIAETVPSVPSSAQDQDMGFPPGFTYNPDIMSDYEEQRRYAWGEHAHQTSPVPSFEDVPKVDVVPMFNPTAAPEDQIYARSRAPDVLRSWGILPKSEWGDTQPVEMWRLVERSTLEDGTGLVSSRILQESTLGDVERFDPRRHYASHHEARMADSGASTPFVSFPTDPQDLAENALLHGFGIEGGRDSVVVRVSVDPDRVLSLSKAKTSEVLLLGGVAPEEFSAAFSVKGFIDKFVPEDSQITTTDGAVLTRDQMFEHWQQPA